MGRELQRRGKINISEPGWYNRAPQDPPTTHPPTHPRLRWVLGRRWLKASGACRGSSKPWLLREGKKPNLGLESGVSEPAGPHPELHGAPSPARWALGAQGEPGAGSMTPGRAAGGGQGLEEKRPNHPNPEKRQQVVSLRRRAPGLDGCLSGPSPAALRTSPSRKPKPASLCSGSL